MSKGSKARGAEKAKRALIEYISINCPRGLEREEETVEEVGETISVDAEQVLGGAPEVELANHGSLITALRGVRPPASWGAKGVGEDPGADEGTRCQVFSYPKESFCLGQEYWAAGQLQSHERVGYSGLLAG
ncbi:hypothetical protein NDU88_000130 [Pleurodeles waltl]|uniref:Uncharacterized protein n=1 Tax=Pleurodeles waltl TaxID=8319 RepID=A0AAV7WIG8_PLEWA|nr:hypothetical protein NDU88_000130 [Pleurodeles waltl]